MNPITCTHCHTENPAGSLSCVQCGSDLTVQAHTIVGGRYQLIRRIGEGGMGEVWEAVQMGVNLPVAIKFLHSDLIRNRVARQRVLQEAKVPGA